MPDCWIYVQDPGYKVGPSADLQQLEARTWSRDVDDTVWIGLEYFCEEGDSFWNMSEEDVTKFRDFRALTRMRVINGPDEVIELPS